MPKPTLASVDQKIDHATELLKEHIAKDEKFQAELLEALNGSKEYPGVRGRLQRLEDRAKWHDWGLSALFVAFIGAVFTAMGGYFVPKG